MVGSGRAPCCAGVDVPEDEVTNAPTFFGREHEAVRHVVEDLPDRADGDAKLDERLDDERVDSNTVVTTHGIVLTIPTEP